MLSQLCGKTNGGAKDTVLVSCGGVPGIYESLSVIKRTSPGVKCIYLPIESQKREHKWIALHESLMCIGFVSLMYLWLLHLQHFSQSFVGNYV